MTQCPNCGVDVEEGVKFCRNCGLPLHVTDEEASTLRLPPQTQAAEQRPTMPVIPNPTAPTNQPTPQVYVPPPIYQPPQAVQYQPPRLEASGQAKIRLGDWLSGGWQIYKEDWVLLSLATGLGMFLGTITLGIMAGPLLMGLYRMAFKTMRGERPDMGDLFNWEGRFWQSCLAFLICALIYAGVAGIGQNSPLSAILSFAVTPFLAVTAGLSIPFILERKADVATAINEVGRTIFSRDAFMWWIVGLVFAFLASMGIFGCGIAVLITLPWIVSASAVAYRDVFGIDDPNRTLH